MPPSRRGKPSVHAAFGETTAVLTGDALIVLAFETLARECLATPDRIAPLIGVIGRAVGMPHGIIAGQAWESEKSIDLKVYHRAKTSSLFIGSTTAGAIAAGARSAKLVPASAKRSAMPSRSPTICVIAPPVPRRSASLAARMRPMIAPMRSANSGCRRGVQRLQDLVGAGRRLDPRMPRICDMLKQLILDEAKRLVPKSLATAAA
jgi:geranylgeranyl diphosphate synthase type II